jgi:hypothetical protein
MLECALKPEECVLTNVSILPKLDFYGKLLFGQLWKQNNAYYTDPFFTDKLIFI